jgi:DNA uptake protein ComE-like DNA-binding protein
MTNRKQGRTEGSVLIIVMWVALGLVSVTLYFSHSMYFEFRAAENYYEGLQAEQAIDGALRYAMHLLANADEEGVLPESNTYSRERSTVGEALYWYIGRGAQNAYATVPEFVLTDEGAKLDLNLATQEMLENLPNMTPEFAAAIIDWRDEDEEVSDGGAEGDVYVRMIPSRQIKNAPFDTVDELMMVYGASPVLVYGEDANMNGILDPNENDGNATPPMDNQNGTLDFGLAEYVTVFSKFPEENNDQGQGNTNGGTNQPDQNPPNNINIQGDEPTLKVNVNTASAAVLACLPGMDQAKAQQLVSYRSTQAGLGSDTGWVSDAVGDGDLTEAQEYFAGSSQRFMVDVAAVGKNGRGFRRTQFVVDTSGEEPVVIFRKDLARQGWALGTNLREELKQYVQQQRQR